jgi:hypothetical protein
MPVAELLFPTTPPKLPKGWSANAAGIEITIARAATIRMKRFMFLASMGR